MTSGITSQKRVGIGGVLAALAAFVVLAVFSVGAALADHRPGATVSHVTIACGETTFTASNDTSVTNMYLVVHANGVTQAENIPAGGSVSITAGPFFEDTTIMWHVFGGGERDFDSPHWNGYGEPGFADAISAYANEVGSFQWVIAGPDDPNPFITWHELPVEGCPLTKPDCKDDGWVALGFENQGQCIRYVNTGKDPVI